MDEVKEEEGLDFFCGDEPPFFRIDEEKGRMNRCDGGQREMKRCIKMSERIIFHSFHKYQLPVVPKEDISQKNIERMNKKRA